MPVLKFNQCDYDCYGKQTKKGFRAYCRKMDSKCTPLNAVVFARLIDAKGFRSSPPVTQEERMKAIMTDMSLVITNSKETGESQSDLTHIFKDYSPLEVQNAILLLLNDGQIKEIYPKTGEKRYITTDPTIIQTAVVQPKPVPAPPVERAVALPRLKELPYAKMKTIPHLPEYMGQGLKPEIIITKSEVERAIKQARQHTGEWQAEILEIALIPKMKEYLRKQNPRYTLERVAKGYVLHPWNSPDRPYASTAYDGFRRNFYELPLHGLRDLVLSSPETVNIPVIDEWLRQDKMGFRNN